MIGLFIASLISTSIYYLYGSGLRTFYQVESTSDLQDEANVIFSMIERDLARGGFVHPIRGDVSNTANCKATISPENAVKIVSGSEISSCFDKPSSDGTVAYRYRVTYKLGDGTSGLEILIPIKKLLEQIIVHHPYLHQILITHRQFIIGNLFLQI